VVIRAGQRPFSHRVSTHAAGPGSTPASRSPLSRAAQTARALRLERLFGEAAPVVLGPADRPCHNRVPPEITSTVLHRLQDNHNPAANDGILTLHHFLSVRGRGRLNCYLAEQLIDSDDPVLEALIGCHSVILDPVAYFSSRTPTKTPTTLEQIRATNNRQPIAEQTFSFIDARGIHRAGLFTFHTDENGYWRIDEFNASNDARSPPRPTDDS
jgi:hypothetical protein